MRRVCLVSVLVIALCCLCAACYAADGKTTQIGGYVQNRVYAGPGSNPEFRVERVSVSAATTGLPNNANGYVEVYYHPWASASGLYLESAYYDTPIGVGRVRIGKGRSITFGLTPSYPNRKTSNYGIVGEAFTQDRIQGIQYYMEKGTLEAGASVQTGYRLGTRPVGDISGDTPRAAQHTVPHLSFRDLPGDLSRKLAFTGRVGGKWKNGFRAGASVYAGSLDPRDVNNLTTTMAGNSLAPGGTPALLPAGTSSKTQRVLGLDAMYRHPSGMLAQAEWYDAKVSELDYDGWDVLVGYQAPSGWKYYARYSQQNMGVPATANPLSWDLRQTSLSMVQPLAKTTWLQYEYEFNNEKTPAGIGKVSNNLFFVELFTAF